MASESDTAMKVIIDTDPGVDDALALSLALQSSALSVVLITCVFGNTDIHHTSRNVVSLVSVLRKQDAWRTAHRKAPNLVSRRPRIAIGAAQPLTGLRLHAKHFHGLDGLNGVHEAQPHHSITATWKELSEGEDKPLDFVPVKEPAHEAILSVLRDEKDRDITIISLGPMTNLALAIQTDPQTFSRVKQIVAMAGCLGSPSRPVVGNVSPVAEFNVAADPEAAAVVFAMTARDITHTYPPKLNLPSSPDRLLDVIIFPLDITEKHELYKQNFINYVSQFRGSPLAEWTRGYLEPTFDNIARIRNTPENEQALFLHDPLCVYYMIALAEGKLDGWKFEKNVDVRVETLGHWTRGMCVVDRRLIVKQLKFSADTVLVGDNCWLYQGLGNRLTVCLKTQDNKKIAQDIIARIFDPT